MLLRLRKQSVSLLSRATYYTLQSSGLKFQRETSTQEAIFPGFDHMVVPNIYTLKPKPGQDAVELHDYDWYSEQLKEHGHVILKNTGIKDPKDFKKWEHLFIKEPLNYDGGQSEREDIGGGVLNVNTYEPPVIDMIPHNELSYQNYFPLRIAFCCFQQAEVGGLTVLIDNRKIRKFMPENLREKILKHGQLVTNVYQNREALERGEEEKWYNNWQDSYHVANKESMIEILERENIKYEFFRNDWLRTYTNISGVHFHEGELYFIHSLDSGHHTYFQFLDDFNKYPPHERPFASAWGNGEEITDQEFFQLSQLNAKYQINVTYEEGDIFLMDNIKFKHGRTPFIGTRKIGALMGDRVRRQSTP